MTVQDCVRHTHVAAAAAADNSQQTADSTATRGCTDVTVSSLLLSLREGQTAQEAVLTWQFFSPPPFPGLLGLEARQLAMVLVLTAA